MTNASSVPFGRRAFMDYLAVRAYLVPGTPLAGQHGAAEIRQIAAGLG